jgi:hypothetical protein
MKTINDLNFGVPEEIDIYTKHSAEIGIIISNYIHSVDGMTKMSFAELVGKTPSDITRWISGNHNFTILTISLIEARTGLSIIKDLSDKNIGQHLRGEVFKLDTELELKAEIRQLRKKVKELEAEIERKIYFQQKENIWNIVKTHGVYEGRISSNVISIILSNNETSVFNFGVQEKCRIRSHGNALPVIINELTTTNDL